MLMYCNAFDECMVMSAAVQILKSGKVVAHVYYDSKPRSYEDCVCYGSLREFSSLTSLIDNFIKAHEKVIVSRSC